jgi:hypothetical protein
VLSLKLDDFWELLALHNLIMEAKFHDNPNKPEIQVSPYVSSIAEKVLEALIAVENPPKGFSSESWIEWREASRDRREFRVLLNKIAEFKDWDNLEFSKKADFMEVVLSPLKASEQLKLEVINESPSNKKL